MNIFHKLGALIVSAAISFAGVLGYHQAPVQPAAKLGTATVTAGNNYPTSSYNFSDNDIINAGDLNLITGFLGTRNSTDTTSVSYNAFNPSGANVTGTVPAAHGGTGTSTLTLNNVILGNGTSPVQFVAPGANGNILTSNGSTWSSQAGGGAVTYTGTAGQSLTANDAVFVASTTVSGSAVYDGTGTVTNGCSFSKATQSGDNAQACAAQFSTSTANALVTSISLVIKKSGTPLDAIIQIRADNSGSPATTTVITSGTLASSSVTGSDQTLTVNLLGQWYPTASTSYWVVATTTSPLSDSNFYTLEGKGSSGGSTISKGLQSNSWNGQGDVANFQVKVNSTTTTASYLYDANGTSAGTANAFVGFVPSSIASNATTSVTTAGVQTGFSGLSSGAQYYLSNTNGAVSSTPQISVRKVGIAASSTSIVITNLW